MPPLLLRPKDVPAPAWFGRYNFQREEDLVRLTAVLGSTAGPSVVLLAGEPGIGRRYLLQAAAHRLSQAGQPVQEILEIDLEGYSEEGSLAKFLELQIEKRRSAEGQRRKDLTEAFGKTLSFGLKSTAGAAVLLSGVLGLKEPIAALRKLFGGGEEMFAGELFSAREAFASFVAGLSGRVILHVTDPTLFHAMPSPENPRRWLPEVAERYPHVVLVVSCGPDDQPEDVVPGARREVEHIELRRLAVPEVNGLLDLRLAPNAFPPDLGETLLRYSHGLPGLLGGTVWKLYEMGALDEDEAGTWGVDDAQLAEVLSEGLLEELSEAFHAHPEHTESLWTFLLDAALCGERLPANLILDSLTAGEEDLRDELTDLIDDELVGRLGVFEDLEYSHTSFPSSVNVYRFREPILRLAILEHFSLAERKERASQINPTLRGGLPVRTRDMARLFVTLAEHLGDEDRDGYLRDLSWWVGTDEAEDLRNGLALAVAEGYLKPESLWGALEGTEERWPAYRRLALLDAYGVGPRDEEGNPLGVPLERLGDFHYWRAVLLEKMGHYNEALRHAEQAARLHEAQSGTHSLPHFIALHAVSFLLHKIGELAQAKETFQKVLGLAETILGREHALTLTMKKHLARVLQDQGDLVGARELLEEVLVATTRLLGPEHPDTLTAKNGLARVLKDQGYLVDARELFEEVLGATTRLVGLEHPDTLMTKHNLAGVLQDQGYLVDARELFEDVLEATTRLLGPEHPNTLTTKGRLASLLTDKGDLARARELCEEVLEAKTRLLGPEHPGTLLTKNYLARVLQAQDDLVRAGELLEEILEAALLGPEHPVILTAKHDLARVLQDRRELPRARELYEVVLEARTRLLGPEHPKTFETKRQLASVHENQGGSGAD